MGAARPPHPIAVIGDGFDQDGNLHELVLPMVRVVSLHSTSRWQKVRLCPFLLIKLATCAVCNLADSLDLTHKTGQAT